MKALFALINILFLSNACRTQEPVPKKLADAHKALLDQNDLTVIYRASTRGYFDYISISKDSMMITSDRNFKEVKMYQPTELQWKTIYNLIQKLDIDALPDLEAPTGKRHYDASYHTIIKIKTSSKDISTPTFDHDAPPEQIVDLVNNLLSVRETIIKK